MAQLTISDRFLACILLTMDTHSIIPIPAICLNNLIDLLSFDVSNVEYMSSVRRGRWVRPLEMSIVGFLGIFPTNLSLLSKERLRLENSLNVVFAQDNVGSSTVTDWDRDVRALPDRDCSLLSGLHLCAAGMVVIIFIKLFDFD